MVWASWRALRPWPSLELAIDLAEAGRFEDAGTLVRQYLERDPDSPRAHMLAAQFALNQPVSPGERGVEPDASAVHVALAHLSRVRTTDQFLSSLAALNRGKAQYRLLRYDEAEASWNEALRLNPKVPEAGWHLLELFYIQGRNDDARKLAVRLHEVEPDTRDRVQLLLELVRQDAQVPAPESVVQALEPAVRTNPGDRSSSLALGRALVRSGRVDEGLNVLRGLVKAQPDQPEVWDAWLSGFDEAGHVEALAVAVRHLPTPLAGSSRFAKHEALVAQERGDWQAAVAAYRRAIGTTHFDPRTDYRLGNALLKVGKDTEAEPYLERHRAATEALGATRATYQEANAIRDLGLTSHPDLYQRIADLRERMGRSEEALAWHRLALEARPGDARSQAAVQRLKHGRASVSIEVRSPVSPTEPQRREPRRILRAS
jgi:tetratricopeptide (TPR) repeat protein